MNDDSGSKKTPNRGWFRKGQCANPGGRRIALPAPQPSVLEILIDKTLTSVRNGIKRTVELKEALEQRTYQDALKGKPMAMREVAKWILERDAWRTKHERQFRRPPAITRHISPDPANADAALVLLGIAVPNLARADWTQDRVQLLLEPRWVQSAIHRRRGGQRLTDDERDRIRRCTRNPDSIRWPRGTDQ
jgi:Family of unknown function (DUF5681)